MKCGNNRGSEGRIYCSFSPFDITKCFLAFSLSLQTNPFRKGSTSFSVDLPQTVCVFLHGMSVLDNIS